MSRFLAWFTTKNGRIFTRSCVGVAGLSIFGIQVAMHGPAQSKLQELCQIYRNDKPKPLSSDVQELVDQVLRDSPLNNEEKKKLNFFNVVGNDLCHVGAINTTWGASIGIPFPFESRHNIDFTQLRLEGHESIDWIVDGEDLLTALIISDKAKRFGLMREIFSCNALSTFENIIISSGCFLLPATFIKQFNKKKNALEKISFKTRFCVYALCYAMGYVFYRCLQDPTKHLEDKKADAMAAKISSEYLEGGIEFYEKILLRNKALRDLLGARGKRMYMETGEENYWLLVPKLPFKKRIEFLEDLKKETFNS